MDSDLEPKDATAATRATNEAAKASLPWADRQDYEDARRGFIATLSDVVSRADGVRVLDARSNDFVLYGDAPDTVNPSLWRDAQVSQPNGLFEVTAGVYQVRGVDLSNVTIIEGDTGIIVIDPLVYAETATAAMALYREHRGDRAVKAVIYTHSHLDHYGGVRAVVDQTDVDSGAVAVIAPPGFLEEAVSENAYAGNAMSRRALYQTANIVGPGVRGQVNSGLGNVTGHAGRNTLIAPTDIVAATGDTRTVDGVEMEFQLALNTEAPSEFLIYFTKQRALCTAEDATQTMHQLYTLRGAQIRDAIAWWKTLDTAIVLFGHRTDVLFAQHTWPRWGTEAVTEMLANQRDMYKYIHDEVLRMANSGMTPVEIAEEIQLPPALTADWDPRLIRLAQPQRQSGLPALPRLVRLPSGAPAQPAARRCRAPLRRGDGRRRRSPRDRSHRLRRRRLPVGRGTADPSGFRRSRQHRSQTLAGRRLRTTRLPGRERPVAQRIPHRRHGATPRRTRPRQSRSRQPGRAGRDDPEMLFDYAGIKLNGPKAWDIALRISWTVHDGDSTALFAIQVRNGVMIYTSDRALDPADLTLSTTKNALTKLVLGSATPEELETAGELTIDTGELTKLAELFDLVEPFPFWFNIVTP